MLAVSSVLLALVAYILFHDRQLRALEAIADGHVSCISSATRLTPSDREAALQRQVLRALAHRTGLRDLKEQVWLASRTRVDLRARHEGGTSTFTLKWGLGNQQRLTLQGELEDLFSEKRDHENGDQSIVVVVVACTKAVHEEQLKKLTEHLRVRSRERVGRTSGNQMIVRTVGLPVLSAHCTG